MGGQFKEKFGCVRYYVDMYLSLHSLIFPRYWRIRFPKWLHRLDMKVITPVLNFFFGRLWHHWQKYIYGRAYLRAIRKWPHLRGEILIDADYLEYIPGVIKKEPGKIHVLGWDGEVLGTWNTYAKR